MNAALAPATVVVRRTIAASAEDLFDAWLDPEALAIWMRPFNMKTTAKVDARVGGRFEILMQGDSAFPHTGEYRVIDRPKRLVFTWISNGTEQRESLVTVDFLRKHHHTEVVVTHELLPNSQRTSHTDGWTSALEHLDEHYAN